eukprot:COSAG01_NODE_5438_length_4263_cov_14.980788_4_plen_640_part_00
MLICVAGENQKLFFSKKSTHLLGYMAVVNSPDPDSTDKEVLFFFMVTDDGGQDDWEVLCALSTLLNDLLPAYFPPEKYNLSEAHLNLDGAGCFNSNLARMAQALFGGAWKSPIRIKTCTICVSGKGKTWLDGIFGVAGRKLHRSVSSGSDHYDAQTTAAALTQGSQLQSTVTVVFTPVRHDTTPKVQARRLDKYHHIKLVTDAEDNIVGLQAYRFTGYGEGRFYPMSELTWVGEPPDPPTSIYEIISDSIGAAVRPGKASDGKSEERKAAALAAKKATAAAAATTAISEHAERLRAANLWPCCGTDAATGLQCRKVFSTKDGLEQHEKSVRDPTTKTTHRGYGGLSARDFCVRKAARADGILTAGSRPQRNLAYGGHQPIVPASQPNSPAAARAAAQGQFNTPAPPKPYRKTEAHIAHLTKMFNFGEVRGNKKYSAEKAHEEMAGRRCQHAAEGTPGARFYTYDPANKNGKLLSVGQIRSWFSAQRIKRDAVARQHAERLARESGPQQFVGRAVRDVISRVEREGRVDSAEGDTVSSAEFTVTFAAATIAEQAHAACTQTYILRELAPLLLDEPGAGPDAQQPSNAGGALPQTQPAQRTSSTRTSNALPSATSAIATNVPPSTGASRVVVAFASSNHNS